MPLSTFPNAAYEPSRCGLLLVMMKNCEPALSFIMLRAMLSTPYGMFQRIGMSVLRELALDGISGAARADAQRAAALNHKSGNAAVKDQAVVKTAVCQRDKIADGLRRDLRIQFAGHRLAGFHG